MDTDIPANLLDTRTSFWELLHRLSISGFFRLSATQAEGYWPIFTDNNCSGHEKIHPYLVQMQGLCSGIFVNGDLQRLKIGRYGP